MLTPRDIDLLALLSRYRYLRSTHLHALMGGTAKKHFIERLGLLYHEGGYLNRPASQWQTVNARYMPAVYALSEAGEQVLIERGLLAPASPLLHRGRGNSLFFQHELMVSDILASIELGIRARHDLRFIGWQEILEKAPRSTQDADNPFDIPATITYRFTNRTETYSRPIRPDAVFGIEHRSQDKKLRRFFALEADRMSEPVYRATLEQSSYLRKLLQYREVMRAKAYHRHLGLPNLTVLTVTTTERHMVNIMALLKDLTEGAGDPALLFQAMPSEASLEVAPPPAPFLLDTAWRRVGHAACRIDQPEPYIPH